MPSRPILPHRCRLPIVLFLQASWTLLCVTTVCLHCQFSFTSPQPLPPPILAAPVSHHVLGLNSVLYPCHHCLPDFWHLLYSISALSDGPHTPATSSFTHADSTLYPDLIQFLKQLASMTILNSNFYKQPHMIPILPLFSQFSQSWLPKFKQIVPLTITPIIQRMFPFKRGLFEDKVSSFWCISDVLFKWHQKFDTSTLTRLSTILTLLSLIPSAATSRCVHPTRPCSTLVIAALGFYLCSMQIHEKTIMYATIPSCCSSPSTLNSPKPFNWSQPRPVSLSHA
jgi:hypothetical protein